MEPRWPTWATRGRQDGQLGAQDGQLDALLGASGRSFGDLGANFNENGEKAKNLKKTLSFLRFLGGPGGLRGAM